MTITTIATTNTGRLTDEDEYLSKMVMGYHHYGDDVEATAKCGTQLNNVGRKTAMCTQRARR